jgi:hypothetical protein
MAILRFLILFSSILLADSIAIEPYTVVYHYNRDADINENNKYFGMVYRYGQFDFGVATYDNSHYTRTNAAYVGYRYELYQYNRLKIGAFAQAGYRTNYKQKFIGYGGIYGEYDKVYLKLNVNGKFTGVTFGIILFKF